jgi:hypothetical protein
MTKRNPFLDTCWVCLNCLSIQDRLADDAGPCLICDGPMHGPLATRHLAMIALNEFKRVRAESIQKGE